MLPPLPHKNWDYQSAAHLLNRAGFGGSPEEIEALQKLGHEAAVESLFDFTDDIELFPVPDFSAPDNPFTLAVEPWLGVKPERETRLRTQQIKYGTQAERLRTWWIDRMVRTRNPLLEKMTLFWHGHFATGIQKVNDAFLMWQQNELFRQHALGNFATLTKAVSRDPAMMIYLDINRSNNNHPNENFAREVMELFTLGIGNYTEEDIRQAARAFTGYRIARADKCSFEFYARDHDDGPKTFLGEEANFNGDGIIDKILAQDACAKFIARKLWRFFATENPADTLVAQLAETLRRSNYEVRPLLREIFSSAEFYSKNTVLSQVKSPVQYVVQTSRQLEVHPQPGQAQDALRQMGQVLFAPPNVKGWDGGKAWISTQTLLARYNLSDIFLHAGKPGERLDFSKIAPYDLRKDPDRLVARLALRLFRWPPDQHLLKSCTDFLSAQKMPFDEATIRGLLHVMMSTPQFQLC